MGKKAYEKGLASRKIGLLSSLANYFSEPEVPELTSSAACSLDQRMASVWGVTLHREQTIAEGHPRCDFRFRKLPVEIQPPPNVIP